MNPSSPEPSPDSPAPVSFFLGSNPPAIQRSLFSEDEAYEVLESRGEFTGERLEARRPEVFRLVVRMIAEGLSTRAIARACEVSPNTVEAVRRTERICIDAQKQELLAMTRSAARLTLERVIELAPSMKPGEASVAFGIVTEKMLLLGGEATTIVGTTSDKMKHASFNDLIDSLPQADVIEIPKTGLSGGNADQKGGAPGASGVPAGIGADSESDVLPRSSIVKNGSATATATDSVSVQASGDDTTGGRGGSEERGGG